MNGYCVAIITKKKSFSRFVELEAEEQGLSAVKYERTPADLSAFSLCFIDIDTIQKLPDAPSAFTVFVSKNHISAGFEFIGEHECMQYPLPFMKLREYLLKCKNDYLARQNNTDNYNTIKFCKKTPNTVFFGGRSILLSPLEAKILSVLCEHSGEAVEHSALKALFDEAEGNMLQVYISRLRKKLGEVSDRQLIVTVRGKGYKINTGMELKDK